MNENKSIFLWIQLRLFATFSVRSKQFHSENKFSFSGNEHIQSVVQKQIRPATSMPLFSLFLVYLVYRGQHMAVEMFLALSVVLRFKGRW